MGKILAKLLVALDNPKVGMFCMRQGVKECVDFSYSAKEGRRVMGEGRVLGEDENWSSPKDPNTFEERSFSCLFKFVHVPEMETLPLQFDLSTWIFVVVVWVGVSMDFVR